MAHSTLKEGLPGIRGLMAYRLETAQPLSALAQVLLHDPNTLPQSDRELIATYVSHLNDCHYCQASHGAIAAHHLHGDEDLVERVKREPEAAAISPKLKALLRIAGKCSRAGKTFWLKMCRQRRQRVRRI